MRTLIVILALVSACATTAKHEHVPPDYNAEGVPGCVDENGLPEGCPDMKTGVLPAPEAVKCRWWFDDGGDLEYSRTVNVTEEPRHSLHGGLLIPRWAKDIECTDANGDPAGVKIKYGLLPGAKERKSAFPHTYYCCYCREDGSFIGGDGKRDWEIRCATAE